LIAHVRVPDFLARVAARNRSMEDGALIVHDRSRILGVSSAAREMGLSDGVFMDTVDIPGDVERVEFDLDEYHEVQKRIRKQVQELSPIAESLELGEFLADVDSVERFNEWFEEQEDTSLPLTAAIAPSGWLARVMSLRLGPGESTVVKTGEYQETLQSVDVTEFWGLGNKIISQLQEGDLKSMAEIYHLDETDRRKLLGAESQVFHQIFEATDPRPINAFSRPRSLSQELYLEEDGIDSKESLKEASESILEQFQQHLRSSASLAYRMTVTFYRNVRNESVSHEFTTPTDEVDVFGVALDRILSEVDDLDGLKIALDVIVGDVDNYHARPQEDANDLEILS
jgi:nucleotidyltransferase/DNA polymerase involved in DNA repair